MSVSILGPIPLFLTIPAIPNNIRGPNQVDQAKVDGGAWPLLAEVIQERPLNSLLRDSQAIWVGGNGVSGSVRPKNTRR